MGVGVCYVGERFADMVAAALRRLPREQPARIQAYCAALVTPVLRELAALGFDVASADRHAMHLFAVRPPSDLPTARLREALAERRIHWSVRTGKLRISPNVYNTAANLDALVVALRAAVRPPPQRRRPARPLAPLG